MSHQPLRCAGALIADDHGRIFVQRRSPTLRLFPHRWDIVGGHLEPGETVADALYREVREETGWAVAEILSSVGVYEYTGDDGLDRIETDVLVRVDGDLAGPVIESGTHTEWRWLTDGELDLLDDPSTGPIRRIVADGFAALARLDLIGFAALVAPAIDRAFIDGMGAGRAHGAHELAERHGSGTGRWLVEFRTALPERAVTAEGLAAVTRYRDPAECRRSIEEQAEAGWLELDDRGGFAASERGLGYLRDLWRVQGDAFAQVWPDGARVARLGRTVDTVLRAALTDAGPALRAMAPVHEPPDATPQVLLLNRLGTLRYHRSDAHAAAWTAAGLTAAEIQASRAGSPQRELIEADTNTRSAGPFGVLTAAERLRLLADLAALPGRQRAG